VWVGNFTGAPMRDVSGVTGAAPVWRDLMTWLHHAAPSLTPAPPAGVVGTPGAFFLAGTEPAAPAVLATEQPRIVAPVSGTIVALDPDIPRGRQRIVFEAEVHGAALRWVVDGEDRGPAVALLAWEPVPGRHAVLLVDGASQVIDTVRFEVRGAPGATQGGQ
jgi:penicillin-binding protein 1C